MSVPRGWVLGGGVLLFFVASSLAFLFLFGTSTYTVKGRVAGIEDGGKTLYVEHEKIPGYMPPMTMPFPVADSSMTSPLESGDAIQFRMAVSGDSTWIAAIRTIADTAVDRHPARTVRPMRGTTQTNAAMLREGDRVPADLTLTAHDGTSIRLGDFRGTAVILTFIYTRCPLPNYCPLMSKRFATLQPRLRTEYGSQAHLLSVSFDPSHDTPAVLREYAAKYTDRLDNWTFATGDTTEIKRITDRFGVFTQQADGQITHNLTTAVVDPDGTVRRIFRGQDWRPEDVLQAVQQSLN